MELVSDKKTSSIPSPQATDKAAMVIPSFRGSPSINLPMNATREAETLFPQTRDVSPITFAELEHSYNASYRELKGNLSTVGFQIALAEKALEQAKADVFLDKYPEFLANSPKKITDNADTRKAFLVKDTEYLEALDRFNMLKALESFMEGRIKFIEKTSSFMKKQMDLLIRSGLSSKDLHNTNGRK